MDKNSIIGILLIGTVLIGWSYFASPSEEEVAALRRQTDSLALIEQTKQIQERELSVKRSSEEKGELVIEEAAVLDSTAVDSKMMVRYGSLGVSAVGTQKFFTLENEFIKIKFSNLGGRPYSVQMKDFRTYDSLPLLLFDGDSTLFGFNWVSSDAKFPIKTQNLFFSLVETTKSDSGQSIQLRLNAGNDKYVDFKYHLHNNDYKLGFEVDIHNLDDVIKSDFISFDWSIFMPSLEKGYKWETQNSSVYFRYDGADVDYLSESGADTKDIKDKLNWVAFKQQFFSTIIFPKESFNDVSISTDLTSNEDFVKKVAAKAYLPYMAQRKIDYSFDFYFVPNKYSLLKTYDQEFDELVPMGWGIFGWVNKYIVLTIFDWLGKYISSFGIIILILTVIIKMGLFPLTYKSFKSTAKMRVLKPEVDEINKKFPKKEDAMKKQQAVMALYKKAGASPMGGCLPMLLQFPFLIALFRFFPASIELRQESFLWADDLSSYDSILNLPFEIPFYGDHVSLWVLLMTITNFIYMHMNNKNNPQSTGMPGMKTMMYIMPLFMLFFFNSYASSLSYYYFVSLLITITQTWIFQKLVDDKALLQQINTNKKKPVKKSKFQERMEEMAKKQRKK